MTCCAAVLLRSPGGCCWAYTNLRECFTMARPTALIQSSFSCTTHTAASSSHKHTQGVAAPHTAVVLAAYARGQITTQPGTSIKAHGGWLAGKRPPCTHSYPVYRRPVLQPPQEWWGLLTPPHW